MDGAQVAARLDGRTVDADPGPHAFVFQRADGSKVETTAIAQERGKGKVVSVTFGAPAAAVPAVTPALLPATPASPPAEPQTTSSGSPLRTAGIITTAVGGAGLVVGAIFGGLALSTKSSDCPNDACSPAGTTSKLHTQGDVSTIGLIAGGVLAAGGLTMILVAPKKTESTSTTAMSLAPVAGPSGGALTLVGRW